MTTLNDYADGFAGGEAEGAEELLKAMQAGAITGRDTANQSLTQEPLKAESLEKTLKLLEYRQSDIKLLNAMPKLTAYNTVEEFLQLESYGSNRGGFYAEGELSDVEDSQYKRRAEKIKYLQVTGEVTMQAQMVRSYVDAMAKEVQNKVMWIQRRANTFLTTGNENLVSEEWNGLYQQHSNIGSGTGNLHTSVKNYHDQEYVIDMRGASLKQADIEKAGVIVDKNYGTPTHLFSTTQVISALSQDYIADQRILLDGKSPVVGNFGTVAKVIATTMGDITLAGDKFMAKGAAITTATAATSSKAPLAPTASGTVPALAVDADAVFVAGDAGSVRYGVTAFNRYGESALTVLGSAGITVTVGSAIDLVFTATGGGSYAATGYRIYRTLVGVGATGNFYPLFEVSLADVAAGYDGGAALKVRDRGRILPNTECAFLTEMSDDVMAFKQLAPISKLDLAVLSMSRRFITFLFATPQLYAPRKLVKFVNCAKTLTA